jgi:hypothetical protein
MKYDNIISELDKLFPDFKKDHELGEQQEDSPGNYLTFFISYVKGNWDNQLIRWKLAKFADSLSQSEDESTKIVFLDFALDFQLHFQEHGIKIGYFLNELQPRTRLSFQSAFDFWNKANGKYRSDNQ